MVGHRGGNRVVRTRGASGDRVEDARALESRASTSGVLSVLVLDALAAGATLMLSGYFRGGLLGLGVAGAIAGAALASYVVHRQPSTSGSLGMSVVGIYSVVLMGRFFGSLSTDLAACLVLAPLVAWSGELPWLRRLSPRTRGAARLASVAAVLMIVVVVAQQRFVAASAARSPGFEGSATSPPTDHD